MALDPNKGYHFHTRRRLAKLLGCDETLCAHLLESRVASFAGTGNPFSVGQSILAGPLRTLAQGRGSMRLSHHVWLAHLVELSVLT